MNDCIELRGEWPTSPDEEERRQAYRQGLRALQAEMSRQGATPFHLETLTVGAPEGELDPQGRHYERIFRHLFGGVQPQLRRVVADTLTLTATLSEVRPDEASPAPVWHGLTTVQLGRAYSPRAAVPETPAIFEAWRRRGDACLAGEGVVRDLAYGPGERQRLDLLLADVPDAPLHVFVHGGYWQAMDKDDHAHLFAPLRERGINVALIEYTLAPQATLIDQVEEVRQAITFLWRQAAHYGYDRHRLQLSGHSAGGHLGAWLLATNWPAREASMPTQPFGSALLVSGLYELEPLRHLPFGPLVGLTNVERARDGSPIHARPHPGARLCLAVGELESEEFHWQSRALAEAWGGEVEVLSIADTHHFSVMQTFQQGELMARALQYFE